MRILVRHDRDRRTPTYYNVDTNDKLEKLAIKILQEDYSYITKPEFDESSKPEFTEEDVYLLPVSLQSEALERLQFWKRYKREYDEEMENYDLYRRALAENDGKLAWQFIQWNSDRDYNLEHLVEP